MFTRNKKGVSLANRGGVLLTTLGIFFLFIVMMVAAVNYINRQYKAATDQGEQQRAFRLAEAGVDYTLFLLGKNVATITSLKAQGTSPAQTVNSPISSSAVGSFVNTYAEPAEGSSPELLVLTSRGVTTSGRCETVATTIQHIGGSYSIISWNHLLGCATFPPTPTPTPSATPTPTPSATPTPTTTPTPTPISSGPNFAGTCVDDSGTGTVAWTNATNGRTDNGLYATATLDVDNRDTHYLKCTNFGFSIPTGATIKGIVMEWKRTINNPAFQTIDNGPLRIVKGGVIGSTEKGGPGHWSDDGPETITIGGPTDLWGQTWTPTDINASNFGTAISAKLFDMGANPDAAIDFVRMTIYYE